MRLSGPAPDEVSAAGASLNCASRLKPQSASTTQVQPTEFELSGGSVSPSDKAILVPF